MFVVASREKRIAAAVERLQLSADEAAQRIDKTDDGRRRYVRAHYDRQWEDPMNYHMVLNTGVFSYEQCADFVVQAARLRGLA